MSQHLTVAGRPVRARDLVLESHERAHGRRGAPGRVKMLMKRVRSCVAHRRRTAIET